MKKTQLLFIIPTLFLFFISHAQEYAVSTIDSILRVDANSIVRKDKTVTTINSVNEMTVKSIFTVTVFNKKGTNHFNLSAYYSPERKIKRLEAIIYDKNGEEITKIKESKFTDHAASSGYLTLAQDGRYKSYNYENANYPYTVEFITEYTTSNTSFIRNFYFKGRFNQSVETSEFVFLNPTEIPFNYKKYNFKDYNIVQSDSSKTKLSFTASNIKSQKWEKLSPSSSKIFPYVSLALEKFTLVDVQGSATDWKSMGAWQDKNLLAGRRDLPQSTVQEITALVSNTSSNKEKAKLIYEYVQNKTRYISIQLGIGGWKPILASEVDKLGYGDCKALTNYTKALLDSQGIPAYYSVINSGNYIRDYNDDLVKLQGNHVILNLPGENNEEDTWLECTSQSVPFGYISGFTDNRKALVITPEGGVIKKTKEYTTDENVVTITVDALLTRENKLSGTFNRKSEGTTYSWYKGIEREDDQQNEYKKKFRFLDNLTIKNITTQNNKDSIFFNESFNYNLESYANIAGDKLISNAIIFNRAKYKKIDSKNRKLPIIIQRGHVFKDTYSISLQTGLKIYAIPKNSEINSKFGSYTISFTKTSENKITINRYLKVNSGSFPKEDINEYNSFFKKISKLDNTKFITQSNN